MNIAKKQFKSTKLISHFGFRISDLNAKSQMQNAKLSGFSLVELLVVISIVAILSISSVVGFGQLGDMLKTRQATGLLADIIKQEELKVLRGDFEKVIVHFLENYVVIEAYAEDEPYELTTGASCIGGNYNLNLPMSGNLTQKDGDGAIIKIETITTPPDIKCIGFYDSEETEWDYQFTGDDGTSNVVRFIHFNIQRDSQAEPLSIRMHAGSRVEILAPYGKKKVYDEQGNLRDDPNDPVILTLGNPDSTSDLTLQ